MLEITDNPQVSINDFVTARNMAETLQRHYTGHLWAVTCQGEQGIATVRNLNLSGNWGYILKLKDLYGDPGMKCVIRAGGEILERYRLSRSRVNHERIDELPTLATGMPLFDHADAKTKAPEYVRNAWDRHAGNKKSDRQIRLEANIAAALRHRAAQPRP